ncbi:hypothetical protein HD806DRAFT_536385 [Xylariaceae sp. AK1471]|nr:hypothetical protein HD806DRAFT_536385 [Xylariaceae sp. AK1471]
MDPAFTQALAELREMQERANEQHRIAMADAKARLATLDQEHAQAMNEADSRLKDLSTFELEMAEADRRLKSLGSQGGGGASGPSNS